MNRYIRRIGDASARRPWTTVGAWAVLAVLVAALAVLSRRVRRRLRRRLQRPRQRQRRRDGPARAALPRGGRRDRGRGVRRPRRAARHRIPPGRRVSALSQVAGIAHVASVSDPFDTGRVSPDGRIALAEISLDVPSTQFGRDTPADLDTRSSRPGRPYWPPSSAATRPS